MSLISVADPVIVLFTQKIVTKAKLSEKWVGDPEKTCTGSRGKKSTRSGIRNKCL
jgi:hypothetical protein